MDLHKYNKIKIIGHSDNEGIFTNKSDTIVIQEKVDGANFRFYITKKGIIIFGSRTQQLTSDEGEDTNMQKNFLRCANYIRENVDIIKNNSFDLNNYIFHGECMVKHTMNYDWEKIPPFLGFDIYNISQGKYLPYKETAKIYKNLNLIMVPLIEIIKVSEIKTINEEIVPPSKYAHEQAEGIVFKNYKKQIFAKYVREKFKEKNKEVFGGNKKHAKTDDEYFTCIYCTNPRIEKWIFKLIDDGNKLDMSLMRKLPNIVYKDIWEENFAEIYNTKHKAMNFGKFKQQVSHRCLEVLKTMIVNNVLATSVTTT